MSNKVPKQTVLEQYPISRAFGLYEQSWAAGAESREKQDLIEQGENQRYYTPSGEEIPWSMALELLADPSERIVGRTPLPTALVSTIFTCIDIRSRDDIDAPDPLIFETVVFHEVEGVDGKVDVAVMGYDNTSAAAQLRHLTTVLQLLEATDDKPHQPRDH